MLKHDAEETGLYLKKVKKIKLARENESARKLDST